MKTVVAHHNELGGTVVPSSAKVLLEQTEEGVFTRAFNPVKSDGFLHRCPKAHANKQ